MDAAEDALTGEVDLAATPPPPWHGRLVRLGALLWIVVALAALYGLHREWSAIALADLNAALARIGATSLATALALTAGSYLCNAALGVLAVVWLGRGLARPWHELFVSWLSSAFTMNAGGTVLGGGSIRMRFAAAGDGDVGDVARITVFTGVAGWAGHALACAILLLAAPPPLSWLPETVARAAGGALLVACLAVVFGRAVWRTRWASPALALVAVLVSALDWLLAGLVLWVLLPGGASIGLWPFVAVVIVSQAVAAFTHVPGGLGVLEVTITKALGASVAAPALAGALVCYRLVYYVAPFLVAIAMLQARELRLHGEAIRRGSRAVRRGWSVVAPRLAALLALGGGFVLLVSAGTPMEESRRELLATVLPLPFIEASHFFSSLVGALLILLARGLQRRIRAAWWMTVALMSGGIVFSISKGFDWEEALVLLFMLACLLPTHEHFHRQAALWTHRFTIAWWGTILSVAAVAVWLGYFTLKDVSLRSELWWRFALDGDASRTLRAAVGAAGVFVVVALAQGLRPARRRRPAPVDPAVVEALVARTPRAEAWLALLGDKQFAVADDGRCGLMYADHGRSRIVMGDPLGDAGAADDLLWRFVEATEDEGMRPVFYHASVEAMPRLVDMGFRLFKLGEEARVALDGFTLEGPARRKLRQSHNHYLRLGLHFELWEPAIVARRIDELREISDAWLARHHSAEKGFSLGRFDDAYLRRFPCAVVATAGGRPLAFANLWTTAGKEELSVDLMRFSPDAPNGVMEGMFVELLLWGRSQGYRTFNLGMAPLSGLSTHSLAPLWHRLASRLFHRGEALYNFQGLRAFKDKFAPQWEPRYLAVAETWSLPAALLDATALVGGGLRETLSRRRPRAAA